MQLMAGDCKRSRNPSAGRFRLNLGASPGSDSKGGMAMQRTTISGGDKVVRLVPSSGPDAAANTPDDGDLSKEDRELKQLQDDVLEAARKLREFTGSPSFVLPDEDSYILAYGPLSVVEESVEKAREHPPDRLPEASVLPHRRHPSDSLQETSCIRCGLFVTDFTRRPT